jgi:hypothetical protein
MRKKRNLPKFIKGKPGLRAVQIYGRFLESVRQPCLSAKSM